MISEEKRNKIKESLAKTREKRKSQVCKIYQTKIDMSSLNKTQRHFLWKVFIEAKWFYNFVLSQKDIFGDKNLYKHKVIPVKVLDKFENRTIECLSASLREALHDQICEAIKVLSKLKKLNFKVGRLKFKAEINTLNFRQYQHAWYFSENKIKLSGCKKWFKVNGLEQIPEGVDFANTQLLRKPSGYYIAITCFLPKESKPYLGKSVGLDFGIKDAIVTSDGEKFNASFPETLKLKRLQKFFAKKKLGSKNRYKLLRKIKREYEKIHNQKHDKINKIVSYLNSNYDAIYIQDEQIKNWHKGLFGKQVQHSILGATKARLKTLESTHVIDKWFPTTKMCYICGTINDKITLKDRTFKCSCGFEEDRDIKAAKTILLVGQLTNSVVQNNSTFAEEKTSGFLTQVRNLSYASKKQIV